MASVIQQFFKEHGISKSRPSSRTWRALPRGKIMPAEKFAEEEGMRLPESIFLQTVTGEYPDDERAISPSEIDIVLKADPNTCASCRGRPSRPRRSSTTASIPTARPVTMAPRYVLQHVLELYAQHGWEPVVAPELEFFLVEPNIDSDYPLKPPVGRSGRPEIGRQSYSIAAVNEFDPLFDDVYAFCEAQDIEIDTLIHEDGAAQMEINLLHGNALSLADQVFLFKRTAREAALRHKMYATFMAKPMAREPGSAMHIHQSIVDTQTGKNIFSERRRHALAAVLLAHRRPAEVPAGGHVAVRAERQFVPAHHAATTRRRSTASGATTTAPRACACRCPAPASRRVENRIGGADANPYLAIAASLACGYLGMVEGLKPTEPISGSAHDLPFSLPRNIEESLRLLRDCRPLIDILGERFVLAYAAVKENEYETFLQVISSWEREHLLLNV